MASARYNALKSRLSDLRKRFLPKKFSGIYTARQIDCARAYRLLAHAEFEAYLEDRGRELALSSVKRWKTDRKARATIMSLLSFHVEHKAARREFRKNGGRVEEIECRVDVAHASYVRYLTENNGVREENVLKILLPLGLRRLDPTWLSTIDSFGSKRGETAHSSVKTVQPPDPKAEYDTVKALLLGLRDIDMELIKL